ncbi:hypothetical protein [Modestobacter sp. Leaf380]|uniref:hypothetical protein n=1 Tax=Modestobacter sp. Leaf380 TaxID=1736356 RepID=UPI0012FB2403|nr:hypothetical protein [Modestobacter sp. Leaf380]
MPWAIPISRLPASALFSDSTSSVSPPPHTASAAYVARVARVAATSGSAKASR